MINLIHYPLDPFSRSIRLALAECGIDVELQEERPWEWRTDFLLLNPAGSLPVYTDESDLVLCGSYSISEYLAESDADAQCRSFAFLPGDEEGRAEVRRLVDWFHVKFENEVTSFLLEEKVVRRFDPQKVGAPDMELVRAARANLRHHLGYIGLLADARNWLAGEELSFADFAAAAHLSCIDFLGDVPWEENESAKNWYARIKSRPSFRVLLDDRVPGFTPPESYADPDF